MRTDCYFLALRESSAFKSSSEIPERSIFVSVLSFFERLSKFKNISSFIIKFIDKLLTFLFSTIFITIITITIAANHFTSNNSSNFLSIFFFYNNIIFNLIIKTKIVTIRSIIWHNSIIFRTVI